MAGPGKLCRAVWNTGARTAQTISAIAKSQETLQRQLDELERGFELKMIDSIF